MPIISDNMLFIVGLPNGLISRKVFPALGPSERHPASDFQSVFPSRPEARPARRDGQTPKRRVLGSAFFRPRASTSEPTGPTGAHRDRPRDSTSASAPEG